MRHEIPLTTILTIVTERIMDRNLSIKKETVRRDPSAIVGGKIARDNEDPGKSFNHLGVNWPNKYNQSS